MIKIPTININFTNIVTDNSQLLYQSMTSHLNTIAGLSGSTSDIFSQSCEKIRSIAFAEDTNIIDALHIPRDIRAIIQLWRTDDDFLEKKKVSSSILSHFRTIRKKQSIIAFYALVQLYFEKYDECGDINRLSNFLHEEFTRQEGRSLSTEMEKIAEHKDFIFCNNSHEAVVALANQRQQSLDDALQSIGVNISRESRFSQQCMAQYYIDTLKKLHPHEDTQLFQEITQPRIYNSPYGEGTRLGHKIIQAIIDNVKDNGFEIPEIWLQAIITIAGDPRVPISSKSYQTWWMILPKYCDRMIRQWLSRVDLALFFEVLEEHANRSSNMELQRMYPARKIFLEGLYKQNLISYSKLFIGNSAVKFLKENYNQEQLPVYYTLKDRDKSIIYLNINGIHIVEGSHNFCFWIYDKLPDDNPIDNDFSENIAPIDLSGNLKKRYKMMLHYNSSYVNNPFPLQIRHQPHLTWQHKVIQGLQGLDIPIKVEEMFSSTDYRDYQRCYGRY